MGLALELRNVVKYYGNFKALDLEYLEVKEGEIFGLLGPNGAGKTTLIKIVTGIMRPSSGDVLVFGNPIDRKKIGLIPQEDSVYPELTVWENLKLFAELNGIHPRDDDLEALIKDLGLKSKKDVPVSSLSGGMRKRVNIGCGIVHNPGLIILDEPTVGLDPRSRKMIWDIIRRINSKGKTVVITTHYMDEAEILCDRVAIMNRGKVIAVGTPGELESELGSQVIEVETSSSEVRELAEFINMSPHVEGITQHGNRLFVRTNAANEVLPYIIKYVELSGDKIKYLNIRGQNLEDVFLSLTGKKIDQAGETQKGDGETQGGDIVSEIANFIKRAVRK